MHISLLPILQASHTYGLGLCVISIWLEPSGPAGRYLPADGITIVTGQGKRTGGKTFAAIGKLLERMSGLAVRGYVAQKGNGAYTVWLNYPRKTR